MGSARAPGGGRRPKPTAIKRLEGNPGRRRLNRREPKPDPTMPEPPALLEGEARAEWDRMAPLLHKLTLLTKVDGAALALHCLAWERLVIAQAKLREHGQVVFSPNGCPIQSPYLAIVNKASEQVMRALVEFGMTPSSRSRILAGTWLDALPEPESEGEDPLVRWEREFGRNR